MRTFLFCFFICIGCVVSAQRTCATFNYLEEQKRLDPSLDKKNASIEQFVQQHLSTSSQEMRLTGFSSVIKVPVVVHVLYSSAEQNISDAQIKSQLDVLNKDYRRQNSDAVNTPERFRSVAADVQIEFYLATADPKGRATTGIIRKKTSVTYWMGDDKIKYNSEGGDNAWDNKSYLNIWIGNLRSGLGYATAPGSDAAIDGVVITYTAFGTINVASPYNMGRTATHEIGHWLGLRHTWGDTYCGDDLVEDTPPQGGFTPGCPTGFRTSCNNGSLGDMYMNYMDFTNDACMNLFTEGQKQRMRALFAAGGPRESLLISKGLNTPWIEEAAPPEVTIVEAKVYPNPASETVTLNFGDDDSWIGKKIQLVNVNGAVVQTVQVNSLSQKVTVTSFACGMYFIQGENNGRKFLQKLIKL